MNIFEERYFSFNRKVFGYMGLWPFEPKSRNIRKYGLASALLILSFPQLLGTVVSRSNIDQAILSATMALIAVLILFKVVSLIVAEDKMIRLYRTIADNWLSITDAEEKRILLEYSEIGRKKTIYYFAVIQSGVSGLYVLPLIPKILDMISPLPDGSARSKIYILEGELLVNKEEHYLFIYLWDVASCVMNTTVCVCIDTMYIVCVEHCCALYAIVKYRLRNVKLTMIDSSTGSKVDSYDYVTSIIELHQIAMDSTATINEAYSMLFLALLLNNIIIIPLDALIVLSNLDHPLNFFRFGSLFVMLAVHLFMLFWPGQKVLDLSTELTDDACLSEWYATPLRTKKILVTFMIRCTRPTLLDAGGLMVMNFETFSQIYRTALSYITVAASLR